MRISIVADVVLEEYDCYPVAAEYVRDYIAGTDQQLIVPGVISWDNVVTADGVREDGERFVTITADLTTEDVVTGNEEYNGDAVTTDFVRDYIAGADVYWLISGALLAPKDQIVVTA